MNANHDEQNHYYQTYENLFSSSSATAEFNSLSITTSREDDSDSILNTTQRSSETCTTSTGDPGHVIVDDINVTSSDVLSGRGKGVSTREGNESYSKLIKQYKDEYQDETNIRLKKKITQRVLDIIKDKEPKGRFMKSVEGKHKAWVVQDDKFAIKKIVQALREKPKKTSSSHESKSTEVDTRDGSNKPKEAEGNRRFSPFSKKKIFSLSQIQRKSTLSTYSNMNNENNGNDNDGNNSVTIDEIMDTNIGDGVDERPMKRPFISSQSTQKCVGSLSHPSRYLELMNESLISHDTLDTNDDHEYYDNFPDEVNHDMTKTLTSERLGKLGKFRSLGSFSHECAGLCASMESLSTTEINDLKGQDDDEIEKNLQQIKMSMIKQEYEFFNKK